MIRIVAVEREYGCGGSEIAKRLAELLGWKLWDHQLTEEIARLANCSKAAVEQREERTDPLYYRLFKSFLRGSYEGKHQRPQAESGGQRKYSEVHAGRRRACQQRETRSSLAGDPSSF